jgi:hypothetical protein
MKKQLIKEAFRLQALAGIKPMNSLNENTPGFDTFMDAVDDMFELGTPENKKLADAVSKALDNDELEVNQYDVDDAYGQVEMIAKKLGLLNEGENNYVMVTYEGNNIQNKVFNRFNQLIDLNIIASIRSAYMKESIIKYHHRLNKYSIYILNNYNLEHYNTLLNYELYQNNNKYFV